MRMIFPLVTMSEAGPGTDIACRIVTVIMHLLELAGLVLLAGQVCGSLRCGQAPPKQSHKFYFAGACVRSKMTLIGASYATSLDQCSQYAISKGGLAVNYINKQLLYPSTRISSQETCLVFDCPEFDVQLSLEIDSLYDYYTLYARPMPSSNVTCIPSLGIFQVHQERLNFTEAEEVCDSEDGILADANTHHRTIHLSGILLKEGVRKAFIGMAQEEGRFVTQSGMPLECFQYRAWAPGEPRNGYKCSVLTDKGFWMSQKCERHLPFICELKPYGPLRPCVNLPRGWKSKCKETYISSLPTTNRWPKCGDPSIDENTFRLPILQTKNFTTEEDEQKRQALQKKQVALRNKARRIPS